MNEAHDDNRKTARLLLGTIMLGVRADATGVILSPEEGLAFQAALEKILGYVTYAINEEQAGRYQAEYWDQDAAKKAKG